jgi:pentatricopeptide repeat protein
MPMSELVFQGILHHNFRLPRIKEIELKEKILGIIEERGMKPIAGMIVPFISLYGKSGDLNKADVMLQTMRDKGIDRSAAIYSSIMKCHERNLPKVESLLKDLIADGLKPDVITYNTMINAYSWSGDLAKAVALFDRMVVEGAKPNLASFDIMRLAFDRYGDLKGAKEFFTRVRREGDKPPTETEDWLMWYESMVVDGRK